MKDKLFIPLILGTNREGRVSLRVTKFLLSEIEKRNDIETQLFDVRDFKFPQGDYGENTKDKFPQYRDAVTRSDGLIIVTPEYNHSYPGPLKTLLDTLFPEYRNKVVGVAALSIGGWAGTRVVESLLPVLTALALVPVRPMNFPTAGENFSEEGVPKNDVNYKLAQKFLDEVVWMGSALKWGRENLDS